ncbi:MAG TPA: N-acetylmuramoyl-L-alanine amidase-like domain-containing protein, partial [Candidatus Didemnitutus sp.]|nr:N-acetylmuramoyl-L-alanine amidase-like domain-containing protein [Candidatus Didemnitutus sp.]
MQRRTFLSLLAAPLFVQNLRHSRKKNSDPQATSRYIYSQALRRSRNDGWNKLAMGPLMGHIGELFLGTPYVGGTLEGDGPEICRIDLTGLDCVTFFENVLDISRVIKKGKSSWEDLVNEITFTRYRNGTLGDYTSRLHYTSEWIEDNVKKNVVRDISKEIDGDLFPIRVNFMSQNPRYYRPLKEDSILVSRMAEIERTLGTTTRYLIPKERIESVETKLQTGDI